MSCANASPRRSRAPAVRPEPDASTLTPSALVSESRPIPIRVSIPQNGSVAELVIGPVDDPSTITLDLAIAALRASEVELTDEVRDRTQTLVGSIRACADNRAIVAMATPPVHGEDGKITWAVEDPAGPESKSPEGDDHHTSDGARIDYYNKSRFATVAKGDRLGMITKPTVGVDGRDVRGRKLVAKSGKPARLRLDETIFEDDAGNLIAQTDGILSRSSIGASIRDLLEVEGYVDFSTGNVNFSGDVAVYRGVRDLFVVDAKGNIEIQGLIEAADIRCGGDLTASGGMAGRERGSIRTGGDLSARYLDGACVEVGGVLRVEREIINCTVIAHDRIDSPKGSILGGQTRCTGQLRVGTLGSASGVPTEIVVFTVPRLEPRRAALHQALDDLAEAQHTLERKMAQLSGVGGRLTAEQKEQQTALAFELLQHSERVAKCQASLDQVEERIRRFRTVDVRADRFIYSGVRIVMGDRTLIITQDLKGPVMIARGRDGDLILREGELGPSTPLASFAKVRVAVPVDPEARAA